MVMRFQPLATAAAFLLLATASALAEPPPTSVSFLVSARNTMRDISAGDLRRIFLGEISRWANGHRIIVFVRSSETPEGRLFLDRLVRMSDIDYSQWWLGAVFRGRSANPPRVLASDDAIVKAVAANPDAIGFVAAPSSAIEPGVAVVSINGRVASDPDYVVRSR
jgi:ABC-type phosphate transport system substrate-binding protein